MPAPLLILPFLVDAPCANMATDLWMLRSFPQQESPRFRHYGWDRTCHTFGYGQDFDWVSQQTGESCESLCRRPTGGGLVDHRDDWTYALVIPAIHPAANSQIRASYEALHCELAKSMSLLGVETKAVASAYHKLVEELLGELQVLTKVPASAIESIAGERVAEGVVRARMENVTISPGFDGEYGHVRIWPD